MDDISITLPRFLTLESLVSSLGQNAGGFYASAKNASNGASSFEFNWTNVLYFEDAAILLLSQIEHDLYQSSWRVRHTGINSIIQSSLLRQLALTGILEILIARHYLYAPRRTDHRDNCFILYDSALNLNSPNQSRIMPVTHCYSYDCLTQRSAEHRKIEGFDRIYRSHHFADTMASSFPRFELIESGNFRNLVLQQTRYNVWEHAKTVVGASIARAFSLETLKADWGLGETAPTSRSLRDVGISA